MPEQTFPKLYGNIFRITRTPWEVILHIFHGTPPLDAKPGTTINLAESATPVAVITVPLEVGRLLIKALEMATSDDVVKIQSVGVVEGGK